MSSETFTLCLSVVAKCGSAIKNKNHIFEYDDHETLNAVLGHQVHDDLPLEGDNFTFQETDTITTCVSQINGNRNIQA